MTRGQLLAVIGAGVALWVLILAVADNVGGRAAVLAIVFVVLVLSAALFVAAERTGS